MPDIIANDKRFEPEEAKICGPKAKRVSTEVCLAFGMTNVRENQERYYRGHIYDLIAEYYGHEVRIETELKKDWGSLWSVPGYHPDVLYKWDTMDFPYRKRNKANVHAHFHDIVGRDMQRLFRVTRDVMLAAPVGDKYCRNRGCDEPFFRVKLPAPSSAFWLKSNGRWVCIRRWDKDLNLVIKDGVVL